MNARSCIACRGKDVKGNLIRLVKYENDIHIDMKKKLCGRGAYIHKTKECVEKMCKIRALDRAFKIKVSDKTYSYLKGKISE